MSTRHHWLKNPLSRWESPKSATPKLCSWLTQSLKSPETSKLHAKLLNSQRTIRLDSKMSLVWMTSWILWTLKRNLAPSRWEERSKTKISRSWRCSRHSSSDPSINFGSKLLSSSIMDLPRWATLSRLSRKGNQSLALILRRPVVNNSRIF